MELISLQLNYSYHTGNINKFKLKYLRTVHQMLMYTNGVVLYNNLLDSLKNHTHMKSFPNHNKCSTMENYKDVH